MRQWIVLAVLMLASTLAASASQIDAVEFVGLSSRIQALSQISTDLGAQCKRDVSRGDFLSSNCGKFEKANDRLTSLIRDNWSSIGAPALFDKPGMEAVTGREIVEFHHAMDMAVESNNLMRYVKEYRSMFE